MLLLFLADPKGNCPLTFKIVLTAVIVTKTNIGWMVFMMNSRECWYRRSWPYHSKIPQLELLILLLVQLLLLQIWLLLASTSIMIIISIRTVITTSNMFYFLNQLQTSSIFYHDHHRDQILSKGIPNPHYDPLPFPKGGTFQSSYKNSCPPYYRTLQQLGKFHL